jgi:DNA-binding transcriptional ArsR family regulator
MRMKNAGGGAVVEPSEVEVRAFMRKRIGALREQADTLELALSAIEGIAASAPVPPKVRPAKPGRVSKARRPTNGGAKPGPKPGKTRARVVEYLAKHPAATAREIADAIGKKIPAVSFHLAAIRKAA